jgi:hypothetical protein
VLPAVRAPLGLAAACLWFVGSTLAPRLADAAPAECFAAADEAQTLRDEGHYEAARERLAVCSAGACPAVVQRDCSKWMEELMQLWPTIVVRARDMQGRDLADVKVSVDGKSIAERLDGTPLQLDPGEHRLSCEADGAPPAEQTIVVRAAEKNRVVEVQLAKGAAPPVAAVVVATPVEPRAEASERPPSQAVGRTLRWVFGGVALTAFGTAAYFGLTGLSRYNFMKSTCATQMECNPSDVSFTRAHFAVSDVSVGLGLVSAAAAAYFFLTAGSLSAPARAAGIVPEIGVWPGGASLGAAGVF